MKIFACVRTRNESANIDRLCQCYAWADRILVADGGSDDDTIARAIKYPNVSVQTFAERVYGDNGLWRNPHGKHINFLIDWARDEGADWMIFDDCDCVPTVTLQNGLRGHIEATDKSVVMLYRLYVWGDSQYFPKMNEPGRSLYAWKLSSNVRAWEGRAWSHRIQGWEPKDELHLERPLACLHYFCPDEATVQRKHGFYTAIGERGQLLHPLEAYGDLYPLPDWAVWR